MCVEDGRGGEGYNHLQHEHQQRELVARAVGVVLGEAEPLHHRPARQLAQRARRERAAVLREDRALRGAARRLERLQRARGGGRRGGMRGGR